MTLINELDLDILEMYQYMSNKNELSRSRASKVRALYTDRQTDTDTHETKNITTPHLRVITKL